MKRSVQIKPSKVRHSMGIFLGYLNGVEKSKMLKDSKNTGRLAASEVHLEVYAHNKSNTDAIYGLFATADDYEERLEWIRRIEKVDRSDTQIVFVFKQCTVCSVASPGRARKRSLG